MIKRRNSATGAEALFAAAFTYALTGILVREVSPMWSDSGQVAARFVLVLVILIGYSLARSKRLAFPRNRLGLIFGLGLAFAGMVLFFTYALGKTTVANVLFVFYAVNMISAFAFGTVLLKENVTPSKMVAIGFALLGVAVYADAVIGGNFGIIFSIFAGICGGATSLISKQVKGVDRNAVLTAQYTVATLFSAVVVFLSGEKLLRTVSLEGSLLTIFFALVIILGSYLTLYGFQHFDVNIGTVIMSSELVFAAIMAYFLYNEVPKTHELVGGVLIMAGSIVGSGIFDKSKNIDSQVAQPD